MVRTQTMDGHRPWLGNLLNEKQIPPLNQNMTDYLQYGCILTYLSGLGKSQGWLMHLADLAKVMRLFVCPMESS